MVAYVHVFHQKGRVGCLLFSFSYELQLLKDHVEADLRLVSMWEGADRLGDFSVFPLWNGSIFLPSPLSS